MKERYITQGQKAISVLVDKVIDTAIFPVVQELMRNVDRLISIEKPSPAWNKKLQECLEQGYWPVIFANHQSHADIFAMTEVASYVLQMSRFRGFRVPSAVSMRTGHQGELIRLLLARAQEVIKPKRVGLVLAVRKKELKEFEIKPDNEAKAVFQVMKEAIAEGYGIGTFPEGTVKGGRSKNGNNPENIFGMQKIEKGALANIDTYLLENHFKGAVYIPFSTHGAFRVFSGDTKKPSLQAVVGALGFSVPPLIEGRLNMPVTGDEIRDAVGSAASLEDIDAFLMRKVAELLPPQAQGFYANDK